MLSGRTNEMGRTLLQVRPKCLIYNALGISDELRIAYGLSRNNANYEPILPIYFRAELLVIGH
ncbi:hypothetical protein LMG28727_04592 [Paraburkholderia kirstenboschensis]|nr:hypothetical protein LMG28727_04592 [Paraburkholderia kirstenboschensis]